jgi:HAD superfamily hydrolase (TIGR01549 family)
MIKNIFWDFDGVILDSMKIKGDGFAELFRNHSVDDVIKLEEFHYKNGGISRFEKIRYFYNKILKEDIDDETIHSLADEFAKIIQNKLFDKSNLICETIEFIKRKKYINHHIASGAENDELNNICKHFEIDSLFVTICGSPTEKIELVKNILEKYKYKKNECVLIGDSKNDYIAAVNNGIDFYGYNNLSLRNFSKVYINSFKGFVFE